MVNVFDITHIRDHTMMYILIYIYIYGLCDNIYNSLGFFYKTLVMALTQNQFIRSFWAKSQDLIINTCIVFICLEILQYTRIRIEWWTVSVILLGAFLSFIALFEWIDTRQHNKNDSRAKIGYSTINGNDKVGPACNLQLIPHLHINYLEQSSYAPFTWSSAFNSVTNILVMSGCAVYFYYPTYTRAWDLPSNRSEYYFYTAILFVVWLLWSEIVFYFLHRLAHHPWLYIAVHKKHHMYRTTRPLYCQYLTLAECLLVNMPSTSFFLFFYMPHPYVTIAINIMFIYNNVTAHRSIAIQPGRHADHHLYNNCNYGNSGMMDALLGTERYQNSNNGVMPTTTTTNQFFFASQSAGRVPGKRPRKVDD